MTRTVKVLNIPIGGDSPLVLIAGPCVIEGREATLRVAEELTGICSGLNVPLIFKASFDKANRSSLDSYRGPGIASGLETLAAVRDEFGVPVTSDVHEVFEIRQASDVLDLLQIPAFLCRQTTLLEAAANSRLPVNVKKGQFLAPWDVKGIIGKVRDGVDLLITERGTTFGYNNLVVDFRTFPIVREFGVPVVYDATHSLQLPGGLGERSGGMRQYVPHLCRAAVACGVDAVFMEVHPDPDHALCDGPNMWPLGQLKSLLESLIAIRDTALQGGSD